MRFIFDQLTAAVAGYVLGLLTAAWIHALWKWWHPNTIRFWGSWYSNPRILIYTGVALAVGWTLFLLKSLW
ncbi:MAG: hypothetical protein HY288_04900 [Planctomycetia bacterium]|nr:hypothetical protein [Planctomycetia bacterium]